MSHGDRILYVLSVRVVGRGEVDLVANTTGHQDDNLAMRIRSSQNSSTVIGAVLKTDDRVIARITDGIYRQPGSALRELIANAYDADAAVVNIRTDRPRFSSISIEDDGTGMSPEALAHLVEHIGASAKRSSAGPSLGVTQPDDTTLSKGGRRLIGKMGIGLFSVSQLTRSFQVITKEKDDDYRTVATIVLRQFDDLEQAEGQTYEAGKVNIWRERAADVASQGTTIVLTNIRPQTRETLQSRNLWSDVHEDLVEQGRESEVRIAPPRFNIGSMMPGSDELLIEENGDTASLPWSPGDDPASAFAKLVDSVWDAAAGRTKPKLAEIFDYYLNMAWQLSLSVPLEYYDKHPFDMALKDQAFVYEVSQSPSEAPSDVSLTTRQSLRSKLALQSDLRTESGFRVFLDDLELKRPLRFRNLPMTSHALKKPIFFVGKAHESFENVAAEFSGGPLSFEAYLVWSPKIVPTEHQGVLVRIHGASGTMFDSTFMRYQVAEQTRLKQITCEIFVNEGLEGALNIDRESFNFAHPHYIYLSRWLHAALRRLASVQKRLASDVREQTRAKKTSDSVERLEEVVQSAWAQASGDPDLRPPGVVFEAESVRKTHKASETASDDDPVARTEEPAEQLVFGRSAVIAPPPTDGKKPTKAEGRAHERKLKSIAQILAAYELLDLISPERQETLLRSIYEVIQTPE